MSENLDQLQKVLWFAALPPYAHARAEMERTYERDCQSLYTLCGSPIPIERFNSIVAHVAHQSFHPNHIMPSHLEMLLHNKRMHEEGPKNLSLQEACARLVNYPPVCPERCLTKFLALLEEAKKAG